MITKIAVLLSVLGFSATLAANGVHGVHGITVPVSAGLTQGLEPGKTKRYVVNRELGRAWIEVDVYDPLLESLDTYRIAVDGMRYDPSRAAVVWATEAGEVICARRSEGGWLFRQPRIRPSGDCSLQHRYVTQSVDNGFTVDEVTHLELVVQPRLTTPAADAPGG